MNNDNNLYVAKIRKAYPNLQFSNVKNVSNGLDHTVLLLDDKYIFRFPKTSHYKQRLHVELKLLRKLTKLPVPQYEWVADTFAGYRVISGKPLTQRRYLYFKNKPHLHNQLAHFLSELHSHTSMQGLEKQPIAHSVLELASKMNVISKELTQEQQELVEKFLVIAPKMRPANLCVTHADLHMDHILVNQNFTGIIDFSDALISDPAIDFHNFWNYGATVPQKIYAKYKGKKDKQFLFRSQLYNLTDILMALYHGIIENKLDWRNFAKRRLKHITKELKL